MNIVEYKSCCDELEKLAVLGAVGGVLGRLGGKVLGAAGKGAMAIGQGKRFGVLRGTARRWFGGQSNLEKAVGGATVLGGAGLTAAALRD